MGYIKGLLLEDLVMDAAQLVREKRDTLTIRQLKLVGLFAEGRMAYGRRLDMERPSARAKLPTPAR